MKAKTSRMKMILFTISKLCPPSAPYKIIYKMKIYILCGEEEKVQKISWRNLTAEAFDLFYDCFLEVSSLIKHFGKNIKMWHLFIGGNYRINGAAGQMLAVSQLMTNFKN